MPNSETVPSDSHSGNRIGDPVEPGKRKPNRWLRRARRGLEWPAAAGVLALAACPWISSWWWGIDLIANFAAQGLFVGVPLLAWWLLWRRWALALVALAACLGLLAAVASPRASRVDAGAPEKTIRVLHFNANPYNPRWEDARDLIERSGADVVTIVEPPLGLNAAMYQQGIFASRYPAMTRRAPKAHTNWEYVLSRWPTREYPCGIDETGEPPLVALVVEHPVKPFGLVLIHPASPRSPGRWRAGNELVASASAVVNRMRGEGLEVLLNADMNSIPTGFRSRLLSSLTDLRRAKPVGEAKGTFPSGLSWPASIAIDDAFLSPGLGLVSWRTLWSAGSDHRPVMVEVSLP